MDESLSDFQDKKPIINRPKNIQHSKVKTSRPRKRIKGQKDIRTLVNKKNELVTYSKEFDKICKQSGLDVDGDQLQLAIALSKSLHDKDLVHVNTSGAINSQGHAIKIRRTLQEYGFKVPNKSSSIEKRRKQKKKYKLLLISDSERQQNISDKYAEILIKNNCSFTLNRQNDNSHSKLYHSATNISYLEIKNDDVFYVTNLITKSSVKSCMLRDWSKIPDRPVSPKLEANTFNFDNFKCSQDILDDILSCSIKLAQEIIENTKMNDSSSNFEEKQKPMSQDLCVTEMNRTRGKFKLQSIMTVKDDCVNMTSNKKISVGNIVDFNTCNGRSVSPDMFDDGSEMEESINPVLSIPKTVCMTFDKSAFMDLTEGVVPNTKLKNQLTETIRNSNDFMDFTNCITSSVDKQNVQIQNLKQKKFDNIESYVDMPPDNECKLDLTQSSDSNDLPIVQIGGTQKDTSLEETVILDIDYSDNQNIIKPCNLVEEITYTDNNDISLVLKEERIKQNKLKNENSNHVVEDVNKVKSNKIEDDTTGIDLTQSSDSSNDLITDFVTQNAYTDSNKYYELGRKEDISIDYDDIYDNMFSKGGSSPTDSLNKSRKITDRVNNTVQESIEHTNYLQLQFENICPPVKEVHVVEQFQHNSNFCKMSFMDDLNNMERSRTRINIDRNKDSLLDSSISKDDACNLSKVITNSNYETKGNCNYNTPNKDFIEANELDSKTPYNNKFIVKTTDVTPMLDYERMSSPERNNELKKYGIKPFKRKRAVQLLTYIYNQTHPTVHQNLSEDLPSSPKKQKVDYALIEQTQPEQCNIIDLEYSNKLEITRKPNLVNIPQAQSPNYIPSTSMPVGPILSFSTVLSPKKSISCEKSLSKSDEVDLSPRKTKLVSLSPKRLRSIGQSPKKLSLVNARKENIYLETKQTPDIKEVICNAEDWVFQKREKAKVHSCRVPLHIAFHNYVSCRALLRQAILCYEPVNIDIIHKDLVALGYRYNPKDLLKFLDMKCITVKTTEGTRNKKL